MSEKKSPYLHFVRSAPLPAEAEQGEERESTSSVATGGAAQDAASLNAPLQQAIMYTAVSWVALVMERTVHAVDIQPIGRRLYEVSVHYAEGEGQDTDDAIILRVRLEVEPGLALHTTVEPVRP
ncbi:MAG TPA: hypothetical protein VE338_07450 [Ktedonobacterales bacterium]|jgi:hypothetical protein|nr:hypothetical protein [Ktedonobacterales bacterium]